MKGKENGSVVLVEGPLDAEVRGRDVIGWRWTLNGYSVLVEISQTAYECVPDALTDRVRKAIETQGRSEIERMLDWDVPTDHVLLTTDDE